MPACIALALMFLGALETEAVAQNLIVNGDFEAGNVGFTSDYSYQPMSVYWAGTYAVVTDVRQVHSAAVLTHDHTTGSGFMFAANGSQTPAAQVWGESGIPVAPNTRYEFAAHLASWTDGNLARLQFAVNGVVIGRLDAPPPPTWALFFATWDSGNATVADISIINNNNAWGGNDFALDDIRFGRPFYSPPPQVGQLTVSPASGIFTLGAMACLDANVRDVDGTAMSGLPVVFTVTGANSDLEAVTTDGNGVATFCYAGSSPGADTVTATVDALMAEALFAWISGAACPADLVNDSARAVSIDNIGAFSQPAAPLSRRTRGWLMVPERRSVTRLSHFPSAPVALVPQPTRPALPPPSSPMAPKPPSPSPTQATRFMSLHPPPLLLTSLNSPPSSRTPVRPISPPAAPARCPPSSPTQLPGRRFRRSP